LIAIAEFESLHPPEPILPSSTLEDGTVMIQLHPTPRLQP
jgi:hypothetical protein